jgi:hypothetical protein
MIMLEVLTLIFLFILGAALLLTPCPKHESVYDRKAYSGRICKKIAEMYNDNNNWL